MSSITFDTHKIVKRLEASGIPTAQAEATVDAFAEMVDTTKDDLATKSDVGALKSELERLEHRVDIKFGEVKAELMLMKWMMGFVFAGVISLVLKAFLHG